MEGENNTRLSKKKVFILIIIVELVVCVGKEADLFCSCRGVVVVLDKCSLNSNVCNSQ